MQKTLFDEIEHASANDQSESVLRPGYKDMKRADVPDDWDVLCLGDVIARRDYGSSSSAKASKGVPMLKMNNLEDGKVVVDSVDYIEHDEIELNKYRLERGDILFNRTNSYDLVGKTALFDLEGDYVFASYLLRLKVNERVADPRFVTLFLNLGSSQQRLQVLATKGVSQANINPTELQKHFWLLVPPLSEQRHIVGLLDTWNRAIQQANRLITAKERRKKALMQQLLTGRTRFPEFSADWEEVRVGDVVEVNPRKEAPEDDDTLVSFIEMSNVSEDAKVIDTEVVPYREVSTGYKSFRNGDVLVAKITPCFENGKGAFIRDLENSFGYGSTEFHVLRPGPDVDPRFLYYLTTSYTFRGKGTAQMAGSAGQQRVRKNFVETYKFDLPPLAEQQQISSVLSACDAEIQTLRAERDALQRQKKGMMQKLLTGTVRVPAARSSTQAAA